MRNDFVDIAVGIFLILAGLGIVSLVIIGAVAMFSGR